MNIAIIPARGGSKGIPGKNLKPFLEKPLLKWTLDACKDSSELNRVYVSSDDPMILGDAAAWGAIAIERDPKTGLDGASTESVLLEVIEREKIAPESVVVCLQATSPYTTGLDIDNAIRMLSEYDSVVSCGREKRFFWNQDGTPLFYSPQHRPLKQQWGGLLIENGALYVSRAGCIQATKCRISGRVGIYEMAYSFELDTIEDWRIGEAVMG